MGYKMKVKSVSNEEYTVFYIDRDRDDDGELQIVHFHSEADLKSFIKELVKDYEESMGKFRDKIYECLIHNVIIVRGNINSGQILGLDLVETYEVEFIGG